MVPKCLPRRGKFISLFFYLSVGFFLATSVYRLIPSVPQEIEMEQRNPSGSGWLTNARRTEAATEMAIEFQSTNSTNKEEWEASSNLNIPNMQLLFSSRKNGPKYNVSCALFPNFYTVQYSNAHWQVQRTLAETYYLYSAYFDTRRNTANSSYDNIFIRVLVMSDATPLITEKNATLKFCQFWFEKRSKPIFVNISRLQMIWNHKWSRNVSIRYYSYLISCQMPPGLTELPVSVSVVAEPCTNATNNIYILHRKRVQKFSTRITPKKNIGVCVKALSFRGVKLRNKLIEWIELLRILGAEKIFFYEYFVDPDIKRVLSYYERQGMVELTSTSLPGGLPNQPLLRHLYIQNSLWDKRLTELVPYNDCLLKNMYNFKYLAVMDIDEVFIPKEDMQWPELIQMINDVDIGAVINLPNPITTYCFEHFYFMDKMLEGKENEVADIPSNFHMLRHIYRSKKSTKYAFTKCLHSTEATLAVHNHFAFFCVNEYCNRHYITVDRAQMNHYRLTCVKDVSNCSSFKVRTERDTKIWRYRDKLIKRGQAVLNDIEKI